MSNVQGEALLHVNSVGILPVSFDQAAEAARESKIPFDLKLEQALRENLSLEIMPAKEFLGGTSFDPNGGDRLQSMAGQQEVLRIAAKRGLDGVLSVNVHDFSSRIGSKVGAVQAAGLHFSVSLKRVPDGAELWQADYRFKDEALTDNLLRIKDRVSRKGAAGWRSAEELVTKGFQAASSDLSSKRAEQFLR
ncbi:MAG: hypothetical protein DCC75_05945 [Proteobacteria bacterium]|nr:MAG: hypothetical protein DCC75_05945 [Pseudomonadota bacterium]